MFDFIPNNNAIDVFIRRLRTAATGAEITNAVLVFTIYNSAGVAVTGASAVAMPYIGSASDPGHYRGSTAQLSLTEGSRYRIAVTSSNYAVAWSQYFRAGPRPFGR